MLADSAEAIPNGAREAFGTITRRLMCYPHVQLICFIDVDVVDVCVVNIVAEFLLGIFINVDVIFSPSIFYSGVVHIYYPLFWFYPSLYSF